MREFSGALSQSWGVLREFQAVMAQSRQVLRELRLVLLISGLLTLTEFPFGQRKNGSPRS